MDDDDRKMDCSELSNADQAQVATLEAELQRKLQKRDDKMKEFAAKRTKERFQLF